MRFEVKTTVKISMVIFGVMAPCGPEDGGDKFLLNVINHLKDHMASQLTPHQHLVPELKIRETVTTRTLVVRFSRPDFDV
jgi:hypothetical protein